MTREEYMRKLVDMQTDVSAYKQEPSGDLISRQAVMDCFKKWQPYMATRLWEFEQELSKLPSVSPQPCEDAISRQALLKLMGEEPFNWTDSNQELQAVEDYRNFRNMVEQLPSVKPQEETEQFAKWVATEIFDEMWEYNKDAFAEIACRKLAELGIVRAKDNEWELIESKESDHKCHTCKHYTSGEHDGSCGSYICKGYSDWESEE